MSKLRVEIKDKAIVITAKIVPGSSKTSIEGLLDDMLKVKVAAPPEKGKANKELISFLAKKLKIKKGCITVIAGQTNPVKQLMIEGVTREDIENLIC